MYNKSYINKCIDYSLYKATDGLPTRDSTASINKNDRAIVQRSLDLGKPIMFPLQVRELNIKIMGKITACDLENKAKMKKIKVVFGLYLLSV